MYRFLCRPRRIHRISGVSTTLKKMRHTAYGLGLIVEGWVRIEFLCLQARIKPWAVWEDRTGEDNEAWVGLCVCGPLGSQISVQDTKPSEEWVQGPAERGDEAWVAGD